MYYGKIEKEAMMKINKGENKKMQINKKVYTTFIITLLTLSMVLIALPAASAALAIIQVGPSGSGSVGDARWVQGTSDTTGGLIQVYWDSVKVWDGSAGFLAEDYAVGTTFNITFVVPEAKNGTHYVIVKDVESSTTVSQTFVVNPKLTLTPSKGLAGDSVAVRGTGFAALTAAALSYLNTTAQHQSLTTSPTTPLTNSLGTFECTFTIPVNAVTGTDNINATAGAGASDAATLTVGPYIALTPFMGLSGSTVSNRSPLNSFTVPSAWTV